MKKQLILLACALLLACGAMAQGKIRIEIKEVRSSKGAVFINLFQSEDGFPSDWDKAFKQVKLEANKGNISYTFEGVPWGTYAVSIAHDENNNGEMDTNFIGMPKEPVGASNQTRLGKPSFNRSKFELNSTDSSKKLEMVFIN